MNFTCVIENKKYEYNPTNYGGYCPELAGQLCKTHWHGYIEIKNRQNKELTDWLNSQKENK